MIEVHADLAELAKTRKARTISAARYFAMLPELESQELALLADLERCLSRTARLAASHATIREDWPNLPLVQKRAMIEEALAAIAVYPANGRRGFTPDRFELVWREDG